MPDTHTKNRNAGQLDCWRRRRSNKGRRGTIRHPHSYNSAPSHAGECTRQKPRLARPTYQENIRQMPRAVVAHAAENAPVRHEPFWSLHCRIIDDHLDKATSSLERRWFDQVSIEVIECDGLRRERVALPVLPAFFDAVRLFFFGGAQQSKLKQNQVHLYVDPHCEQLSRRQTALLRASDLAAGRERSVGIDRVLGPAELRVVHRFRKRFAADE